jgi:hypothetical protein
VACIPGSVCPSSISSIATPPVEHSSFFSSNPNFAAETESPPPTNENAPFSVDSAIYSPKVMVPFANFPFQNA